MSVMAMSGSLACVRVTTKRVKVDVFPVAVELTGTHELIVDAIDGNFPFVNQYDP